MVMTKGGHGGKWWLREVVMTKGGDRGKWWLREVVMTKGGEREVMPKGW